MKVLYLAWQEPKERTWIPVGKLSFKDELYWFVYTKGAQKFSTFIPFGRMSDLKTIYESRELFPLFANRLLSKSRPEYKNFLHWLNVKENEDDPLALLALTGGMRETDSLIVFPCPERSDENTYHVHFFSQGIRYLSDATIQTVNSLSPGDLLYLMPDPQNPGDSFALALRTNDPPLIVGYCPRYLSKDFLVLLRRHPGETKASVERVNPEAPMQLRLLCNLTAPWPEDFQPCSDPDYEPLVSLGNELDKEQCNIHLPNN
jgi:HIRAN domain